jgi:thioredoxin-dependent peroxiredoxin
MIQKGSIAPDFSLKNQRGELKTLSEYKGKWVVLYFYPKDNTPGCTTQACSYRDSISEFKKRDVVLYGISKDDVKSHQKFEKDFTLNFDILADNEHQAIDAYGLWVEKNMYGKKVMGVARTTFIINPEGIISHVFEKVDPSLDVELVLKAIDEVKH